MKRLFHALLVLAGCTFTLAQTDGALIPPEASPPVPAQWGSLGAATRFFGNGVTLAYGQRDLLAPGTDARFGVGYFSSPYGGGFGAQSTVEVWADALATTYEPAPGGGLALIAYGGLGPRFLVQTGIYDYLSGENSANAYLLSVGGLGGLEARLNRVGLFLELEATLPAFGLIGPQFRAFPFDVGLGGKLTLGSNVYF
jgi:hypothetical protein